MLRVTPSALAAASMRLASSLGSLTATGRVFFTGVTLVRGYPSVNRTQRTPDPLDPGFSPYPSQTERTLRAAATASARATPAAVAASTSGPACCHEPTAFRPLHADDSAISAYPCEIGRASCRERV